MSLGFDSSHEPFLGLQLNTLSLKRKQQYNSWIIPLFSLKTALMKDEVAEWLVFQLHFIRPPWHLAYTHLHSWVERDSTHLHSWVERDSTHLHSWLERDSIHLHSWVERDSTHLHSWVERDSTHLHSWVERDSTHLHSCESKPFCLRTQHNDPTQAQGSVFQRPRSTKSRLNFNEGIFYSFNQKLFWDNFFYSF